ncbi:MAG: hypothetical protein A2Z43_09050 [Syntrophobacterales bacterium RBG_19FT_COMBO_59_10]|nr:MAG: hypothetical protein A2Z43_09050 [Syntrophobacterales bacterium RBG_19FT_COMBO_59_10]
MTRFSPAFVFLLSMAMICFPAISPGEEGRGTQVFETEGIAAVTGLDLARARDEAVRDALQKAVERAAGQWLSPQDLDRRYETLKEKIYDRAEGFIQDFRILFEISDLDIYSVRVRVTVFADSVRKDLQGLGLLSPSLRRPSPTGISLTLRGVHDYRSYVRWKGVLKDMLPGIREITPREASWGVARFDVTVEGTAAALSERLREKLGVEVRQQDDHSLEVNLDALVKSHNKP